MSKFAIIPDFTTTASITRTGEIVAQSRTGDLLKELKESFITEQWSHLRGDNSAVPFIEQATRQKLFAVKLAEIALAIDEEFIGKDHWFDVKRISWLEKTCPGAVLSGLHRVRNRATGLPQFCSLTIDLEDFSVYYSNHGLQSIAVLTH